MTYLAHIAGDGRKQTAAEHLNGTAERCALFAAPFGAEELGRLAGLSHDLGKYSMEFQRRLAGGPKVDHATAGAFACWRMGQPLAAFAAAGHHGGLPDGGTQGDSPDAGTFLGRMKRAERGMLPDCSPWTEEIALPSPAPPPCGAEPLSLMFFTRMLFSCLTDADFLDTEAFMDGSPRPEHPLGAAPAPYLRLVSPSGRAELPPLRRSGAVYPDGQNPAPRPVYPHRPHRGRKDGGLSGLLPGPG